MRNVTHTERERGRENKKCMCVRILRITEIENTSAKRFLNTQNSILLLTIMRRPRLYTHYNVKSGMYNDDG